MNSMTSDEKAKAFINIMKKSGFTDKINEFTIKSLIEIPDLEEFFEWFVLNVNENWVLTSEQKFWFKEKERKGQVIYDLERLEATNKMIVDDELVNEFDIEMENELLEQELEMLNIEYKTKVHHRSMLNNKLTEIKKNQHEIEAKDSKIDATLKYKQSKIKALNQSLNKSLVEFQAKLGTEEKFNEKICADIFSIERKIESYVENEKKLFDTIKELMWLEFDYNDLENFIDPKSAKIKHENIGKEMLIMHGNYPEFMSSWLSANLSYKSARCSLLQMENIYSNTRTFFEYTQDELEENEAYRNNVETRIAENKSNVAELKEKLISMSSQIENYLTKLSDLKLEKLLKYDMDQKFIELNLFLNKQEKLSRLTSSQNSRVRLLEHIGKVKINEIESLKSVLEELVQNKSILTPSVPMKAAAANQTNLTNSFYTGNMTSNSKINNMKGMNSFYNSSFSASMANLLSSTTFPGNSNSPPNISNENNPSPFMSNMFRTSNISHSTSLNCIKSCGTTQSLATNNQEFTHILNKHIINLLSHLQSDETAPQNIFKFKKQISVNFTDNLNNLLCLFKTINDEYKSAVGTGIRQNYENIAKCIEDTIAYCYEKDSQSVRSKHLTNKYDLSSIKLSTAKFLEKPLECFEKEFELLLSQSMKPMKAANSEKELVENNSLEWLKREFYVYFVTKPQIIETIISNLNQIHFN